MEQKESLEKTENDLRGIIVRTHRHWQTYRVRIRMKGGQCFDRSFFGGASETLVLSRKPVRSVFRPPLPMRHRWGPRLRKTSIFTSSPDASQIVGLLYPKNKKPSKSWAFCSWGNMDFFLAGERNARPVPKAGSIGFSTTPSDEASVGTPPAKNIDLHFKSRRKPNYWLALPQNKKTQQKLGFFVLGQHGLEPWTDGL
jgi:hypothetical protein